MALSVGEFTKVDLRKAVNEVTFRRVHGTRVPCTRVTCTRVPF
jgi:hypothetical protein